MWSEILRVKPLLDAASAAVLEKGLHARFQRVAKRFGAGLKGILKGSVIGLSLGLLSKLLNPLEALEEKLKKLMGQGSDLRDMADRFGTTPGKVLAVQSVARSFGVKDDELKEAMTKYAEAVEAGRKELKLPGGERSDKTQILEKAGFLKETDLAEGFVNFLDSIKRSGANAAALEEEFLGGKQFGGMKRLIGADFMKRAAELNLPQSEVFSRSAGKFAGMQDRSNVGAVIGENEDFVKSGKIANNSMVDAIQAAANKQAARDREDMANFHKFSSAAEAIGNLIRTFEVLSGHIASLLKVLNPILVHLPKIASEAFWKGIFKSSFGRGN